MMLAAIWKRTLLATNISQDVLYFMSISCSRECPQRSVRNKEESRAKRFSTRNVLNPEHHPCIDLKSSRDSSDILKDLNVFENFLTESEEKSLLSELEPYMKRLRYEFDHWDDAIHGYRETEKANWNESNKQILNRVLSKAFPAGVSPLRHIHVLDLSKEGYIKPHIDSVRFCGDTIAGLSLLSDSVMRLVHEKHPGRILEVLLPRRSLYILRKSIRYEFTHEILEDKTSYFRGEHVPRSRRISVICRNEPEDVNQD